MVPAGGQHTVRLVSAGSHVRRAAVSPLPSSGARHFPHLCEHGLYPPKGQLPKPIEEDQVLTAMAFLSQCSRRTKRGKYSAWFLREAAERWSVKVVSSGALIAAALRLGFVVEEHPNCLLLFADALIGISKRDFLKLTGH